MSDPSRLWGPAVWRKALVHVVTCAFFVVLAYLGGCRRDWSVVAISAGGFLLNLVAAVVWLRVSYEMRGNRRAHVG